MFKLFCILLDDRLDAPQNNKTTRYVNCINKNYDLGVYTGQNLCPYGVIGAWALF